MNDIIMLILSITDFIKTRVKTIKEGSRRIVKGSPATIELDRDGQSSTLYFWIGPDINISTDEATELSKNLSHLALN